MEIEKIKSKLKRAAKICRLTSIGFVATEGSSAGISLLFYPDNENLKKEISAKIVGVVRNISNLKISIMKEMLEMAFNSGNNVLYLYKVSSSIYFHCIFNKVSKIRMVRLFIFFNKRKFKKIFDSNE
jgi:hypothetical protein